MSALNKERAVGTLAFCLANDTHDTEMTGAHQGHDVRYM